MTFARGKRARQRAQEARAVCRAAPALSRVLAALHSRLGEQIWTVRDAVELGVVDGADARPLGFLLRRHAGQALGGLRLVRLDATVREGRLWSVKLEGGASR